MNRKRMPIALGAMVVLALATLLLGCGFKRQLVSIEVIPSGSNITGTGVIVDFKALGHYIHPPDTHDITDQVTWESSAPQIISIDANTGVAVSGDGCGTNILITATGYSDPNSHSGGVVVGTGTVSVTQKGNCQ